MAQVFALNDRDAVKGLRSSSDARKRAEGVIVAVHDRGARQTYDV